MQLLKKFFKKWQINILYSDGIRSTPFDRNLYEQETVRAIIDCIATYAAKAEAMHVVLDSDGRIKEIKRNSPYAKLLNERPNPLMTGYDLKYRLVTHMQRDTTAYCYIKWNDREALPEYMLPIDARTSEAYVTKDGSYAIKFKDISGNEVTLPVEDVVVLRKYYCDNEMYGNGNYPVYNTLNMLKAADEGLQSALSVANKVRGLFKQKQAMLSDEDKNEAARKFEEQFDKASKRGGVIAVDSMEEFTPLNVTPWAATSTQVKEIRDNLLRYWRISDDVLMSRATPEQIQTFLESVIEPILMQMSQAFTATCFTPTERAHGNRIIFMADTMVYMSLNSKTSLVQSTSPLGIFTKNEYRAMFGYPPIEGGDEPLVSLNYIKASDQSKYQVGEDGNGQEQTG